MAGLEVEDVRTGRAAVLRRRRRAGSMPSRRIPTPTGCACAASTSAPARTLCDRLRRAQRGRRHEGALRARRARALPGGLRHCEGDDARRRVSRACCARRRSSASPTTPPDCSCSPTTPGRRRLRDALDLDDTLLTLKLTPNRADCLSIVGVAREVAAVTGAACACPLSRRSRSPPRGDAPVRIEDPDACGRFVARVVEGIDPQAPTPEWIRQRLDALRPAADLGGGRRHQLRDARAGPAAARLRRRAARRRHRRALRARRREARRCSTAGARSRARPSARRRRDEAARPRRHHGRRALGHRRRDDARLSRRRVLESDGDPGALAPPGLRRATRAIASSAASISPTRRTRSSARPS